MISNYASGPFQLLALVAALALTSVAGCEPKEEVLDIETPAGEVEVEQSTTDGDVDVEVDEN